MLNVTRSPLQRCGVAALSVGLALVLTIWLGALIQPKILILFFAAVTVSAWFGGLTGGLTATILSCLAIAFFFIPPLYSFVVDNQADRFQLITFGLVGLLISSLNADLRNSKQRAKTALAQLQTSEDRYRQILDTSYEGIWLLDANLRTEYANQRLAEMLGYSLEEMQNRSLFDFMDQTGRVEAEYRIERRKQGIKEQFDFRVLRKDGSNLWVLVSASPILNQRGEFAGTLTMLTDISDRKQSEDALRASESRFRRLFESNIIGINFGDLQGNILDANDAFLNLIGYTRADLQAGQLQLEAITPPEYHHLDEQAGRQSLSSDACAPYEKEYIRKDGSRVSVLVAGARLEDSKTGIGFIVDLTERKRIEQTLRYLAETSIDLSTSLDYQTTLQRVAQIAVPEMADWCTVDLLNLDGTISRLPIAHADSTKAVWAQQLQHYPPDPQGKNPIAQVLKTGESVLLAKIPDALIKQLSHNAEHLQIIESLSLKSAMIVPLIARQQILGTLSLAIAASERRYSMDDLSLAEDLARRAALAIDNARLYRATQEAQRATEQTANRTARLQKITAALSEALTPHQVADVVMNQGIAALGATAGSVALLADQGLSIRVVNAIGYPSEVVQPWQSFSVTASTPLAKTVRTGEAIFLENAEALLADYPHLADAIATTGNQAFTCIPLNVEGRTLGAMGLSFRTAQSFNEEDRAFMLTLGQQCAQAIARAQLYAAEQAARSAAESANRVKDEFLAVLSHELRTPLNPILGWTQLLKNRKLDAQTVARALDTIERNAKLQTQLIEDLLDVSRILQGKLKLNFCPVNLASVIEAAIETVRLSAEAKFIQLSFHLMDAGSDQAEAEAIALPSPIQSQAVETDAATPTNPATQPNLTVLSEPPQSSHFQVSGNPARLQQIVWNLLSNAVKFTPNDGRVEIRLEQVQTEEAIAYPYAQITVSDSGIGINPEFVPYIFDYFRQADSATTRKFGGLGLGLAIVRHLVELHGGTVHAESSGEGQGATFKVKLPLWQDEATSGAAPTPPANLGLYSTPYSEGPIPTFTTALAGIRVLIVDDEPDTREVLVFLLRQAGATAIATASAGSALEILDQCPPKAQPHILLSDIGMPEMDGYMLIEQIRARSPEQGGNIPAIALTAYAAEYDQQRAISAGFQMHLAKPIEPQRLVEAIIQLLA
ncbi:PAS domain S-box protein [Oculatella sp. FACHB-28]|uniref:hybrid sensor histidine kinase/response regulator n=1 Tax=Oculatella sp. FACHB-28 TaxID=2692845 RepID=UPI00168446CD|nr:PAS domain S-box protein [Oculatella sp. FACHB-28]MBD2056182.1 PAS domain S-box protein [Oculatella sp. FACHB-28]